MIWRRRWSDKNFNLWPFTFSWDTYPKLGVMLDSGRDESPGCHIRFYLYRLCLLIELPPIIRPYRIKHMATTWDAATIARIGRDYYFEEHAREYGFSYSFDGAVHAHYGPQTHDSITTRSSVLNLPWANWRHVRHSIYDLDGKHYWTEDRADRHIQHYIDAKESVPAASFEFLDFDGERITARTHIEEREWLFGTDWCEWLSLFRRPKIHRSLDIEFSKETGKRKGSWKGGTVGSGIEMLPGEFHESAFRRYCAKHEMTFQSRV